ncbi:MAG: hypothetical protein ACXVCE_11485, partial [Bacteriovorax sp.]
NESELQDIMAEIENLEKEFEGEPVMEAEPIVVPVKKTSLQEDIEREIEMSMEVSTEKKNEMNKTVQTEPSVLSFDKKPVEKKTIDKKTIDKIASTKLNPEPEQSSEISFEAHGQMNLNLGFKIGEESAKLCIDPVKGLVLTMNGVELCINQEVGCIVTMDSGVHFTIPLTSSKTALKKKTA